MVTRDEPPVRREAANALGRIGSRSAVPALMAALRGNTDRFLDHSLIYALIRIADREETAKGLSDPDVYVRRGALLALDQMDGGRLTPDAVTPMLDPAEPLLQKAALQVIGRHADWGGPMRAYFQQALARAIPEDAHREELKQQLAAFATAPDTRDLIAERLHDDATPADVRLLLLEVIAQAPVDRMPEPWAVEVARALTSSDDRIVRQAVLCARTAPSAKRPLLSRTDPAIDFPDAGGPFGATQPVGKLRRPMDRTVARAGGRAVHVLPAVQRRLAALPRRQADRR